MELNSFVNKLSFKPRDFLLCQLFWGHKKSNASSFLNLHILGFKNDFIIFNLEHQIEYLKRCLLFSFKAIFNSNFFLFLSLFDVYRKINSFFCFRCLQALFFSRWVNGIFTNNLCTKPFALFTITSNKNLMKEAFTKMIPVICFEDSDYNFNKGLYTILGNDKSKKSIYFFYTFFSNFILKCILLKYFKKVLYRL